jgi:alpha-mannosidase
LPGTHLVVVPHTHWDREWHRTHEEFRYLLVRLMDGLLDLLEADPGYRNFTLDGQTIVLDDYLEVRPEARERIRALVRSGRLLVGPWYVLPDEWLVSGEALIRNLRRGLERAAPFGGAMRIGYVPDQFGHVGQLPQILAGFGLDSAVLWRGIGREIDETLFTWEAPDGTRVLAVYLRNGYSNAAHLPLDPDALRERLRGEADRLGASSRIPTLLLMNGSDHLEPQPGLPAALAGIAGSLDGISLEIGTLPDFVARARREAPASLPVHRGELRSGLRAPVLEGCASARAPQKRADFRNDRLLTRYLEPLAAWVGALGGDGDPAVIDLAWRLALQNHPHDSICGCSIDAVHEQMETRFARVSQIAGSHLRRVAGALAGRVAGPAAGGRGAGERLLAWNPNAGGPVAVEGEAELDVAGRVGRPLALHLRDADGRRLPLFAEIVAPGATAARYTLSPEGAAAVVRGFPPEFMGQWVRDLRWRATRRGLAIDLCLGVDPPRAFDLAAAKAALTEALAGRKDVAVDFRARRLPRVRLRFVDEVPGCGLRVYRTAKGRAGAGGKLTAGRTPDGGAVISNAVWRVEARPDGRVRCRHLPSDTTIEDAVRLVSEGDRGDTYNFDPVPGEPAVQRPDGVRVRLAPAAESEVGLVVDAHYRVPAGLSADRTRRSKRRVDLKARLELRLLAGLDRVDLAIEVDNAARDHRLRAWVRAPFPVRRFEVESAFEIVERPIAPGPSDFGSDPAELPIGATPQRSFASLIGDDCALTLANRGCTEAEAVVEPDGSTSLAVTALRAVGWLSRDDLALRRSPAGPSLETPGAQVPGRHRLELAWRLHAPGDPLRTAEAHRFAFPALVFAGETSEGAVLADGARLVEVDDPAVVISAIEPVPEGPPVVRLVNASSAARRVRVRWNGPGASALEPVDLAGQPAPAAGVEPGPGASATLALRPWQIVSLRPTPRTPTAATS